MFGPGEESTSPWAASPGAPETVQGSINSSPTENRISVGEITEGAASSDEKGLAAAGSSSKGPFHPLADTAVIEGTEPRGSISGRGRTSSAPWKPVICSGGASSVGAIKMPTLEGAATWPAQDEEGPPCSRTGGPSRPPLAGETSDGAEEQRRRRRRAGESSLIPAGGGGGGKEHQAQARWST